MADHHPLQANDPKDVIRLGHNLALVSLPVRWAVIADMTTADLLRTRSWALRILMRLAGWRWGPKAGNRLTFKALYDTHPNQFAQVYSQMLQHVRAGGFDQQEVDTLVGLFPVLGTRGEEILNRVPVRGRTDG